VQARPVSLHGLRIKFPVANSVRIFGSVCAAADATFAVRVMGREELSRRQVLRLRI